MLSNNYLKREINHKLKFKFKKQNTNKKGYIYV